MLVVVLRAPIRSMLSDSWVYKNFVVIPYEFGLESALITIMTILFAFYTFLKMMDYRAKLKHNP